MNRIGIMQGRLSPPDDGKIQSFPLNSWRDEFFLAHKAELDLIEWIYEKEACRENPLGTGDGLKEIKKYIDETSVDVKSICADYFMTEFLIGSHSNPVAENIEHLKWLIGRAYKLSINYIILPFVDSSGLKSGKDITALIGILDGLIPFIEDFDIELHLETDLKPDILSKIFSDINHPLIRSNYDIGNSASLGYDTATEFKLLSKWISSVHVKDRLLYGFSVPLGSGNANIPLCFDLLKKMEYSGSFILQAARDENVPELELARRNKEYILDLLSKAGFK